MKEHCIALLMGGVVALLVVSPHIRAFNIIGDEHWRGVYSIFSDDEITYQARIKEVAEGNLALGNPYIKEHKNDPFIMPPLAEWMIAAVATLTGTSVPFVTSAGDFSFGYINFILVYVLFCTLTRGRRGVSLLYTLVFFVFFLSTYGRPISPQFNTLFLFLGLITITKIYLAEREVSWRFKYGTGLIAGITCFISPYYFTALLAFAVLAFMTQSFFEKSWKPLLRNVPWFLTGFLPLASLYAYFQLRASNLPFYDETMSRYGMMHTHIPGSFTNMVLGGIVLTILIFCFRFLSVRSLSYGVAGVVTIFALNWQNVITGTSLQFSSHYLLPTILFSFLSLALIHTELISKWGSLSKLYRMTSVASIIFLICLVGYHQKREFTHVFDMPYSQSELLTAQSKMDVFDWLNIHTDQDSVVYTLGGGYDFLLPVYTKNNVYFNFYAALYPASHRETEERWLIQHLFDTLLDMSTIREAQREFWGNRYIDTYQSGENRKKIYSFLTQTPYIQGEMIPKSQFEYMYIRWFDISTRPLEENLARYEIDYILLSPEYTQHDEVMRRIEVSGFFKKVAEFPSGSIYELLKTAQ